MDEQLTVKLTHSNTVRERKPYTIYEIEVRSSSTITWIIYKRYSSFDDLHEQLQKFINDNISTLGPIKLPTLPPKRLTRSLAAEFVDKRKHDLQEYLRSCLQLPHLLHSDIMLNFLEVPDSVRPMLQRLSDNSNSGSSGGSAANANGTSGGPGGGPGGAAGKTTSIQSAQSCADKLATNHSPEERRVLELISALRTSQNKVAAIRNFETWFFSSRPRLSTEYIKLLFDGQFFDGVQAPAVVGNGPPSDMVSGLVHVCGDFRHSRCAARSALYLITRLLDPEKNKDAPLFVDQLATLQSSLLQRLRLNTHILSSRGNRPAAFTIIHTLQQYVETRFNTSTTANASNQGQITLELLVPDTWARQEYLKWLRVKNSQNYQLTQAQHDNNQSIALLLRGTSITAYKPLIQQGFQQLLQICSRESGWRDVDLSSKSNKNGEGGPGNPLGRLGKDGTGTPQPSSHQPSSPLIPPPPQSVPSPQTGPVGPVAGSTSTPSQQQQQQQQQQQYDHLHTTLSYQRDDENGIILLRSCVLLPFSVAQVNNLLTLPDLLSLWDEKIHSASVTQKFDGSSDILHLVYHTNGSFYQHKDFSLLRSLTQLQDGSVILLYRSVNIHSCAEIKGYQRCVLSPSGYIISPISQNESLVTLLLQLDHDSVLLYASDLLGESHDIKLSWYNLYNLLSSEEYH